MSKITVPYEIAIKSYNIEYDYDRTSCIGCGDDYCRCTRIVDTRVTSVGLPLDMVVVRHQKANSWDYDKPITLSVMQRYAIDRLFRIHRFYDTSLWEVNVVGGYYGEEVEGCRLESDKRWSAFVTDVQQMLAMDTDIEIVRHVLTGEYSYIHESFDDATHAEIISINGDRLRRQDGHFSRVKRNEIDDYQMDDSLPIGVVYKGERLIDGYHRLAKAGSGELDFINIY